VAENWDAIANEVAEAIASVGFMATLYRRTASPGLEWQPPSFTTAEYTVIVIDDQIKVRNAVGELTGETRRVLTMSALGTVPQKDDRVLVRGTTHVVLDVLPVAPGGVDLLFDVEIGGPDGPAP
jgi:hypothetical protein